MEDRKEEEGSREVRRKVSIRGGGRERREEGRGEVIRENDVRVGGREEKRKESSKK